MPVLRSDLSDEFLKRKLRLFDRHNNELPASNGNLYRRVFPKV
ncbi:MAG TPA: hypothetical protein VGQ46_18200 [Thermoanaerobaculia bacterium]|nr:hypothetical protein [Thermoanaerobaculia bacterium]